MLKRILSALLFAGLASPAWARDPAYKLATPVFDDPSNDVSIYATPVSSKTVVKIYAPDQNRDVRGVRIYNPSPNGQLHLSTWQFTSSEYVISATSTYPLTWALDVSTRPNSYIDLPLKTTFYAVFDGGVFSTGTIRALERWNNQSKTR